MRAFIRRYLFIPILIMQSFHSFSQDAAAPVTLRSVPDSITERLKKEEAFLYANDPEYWKEPEPQNNTRLAKFFEFLFTSPLVRWIVYILIGSVILFVLYQVAVTNNFFLMKRAKRGAQSSSHAEVNEDIEDLDLAISNAVSAGEYRLATRFHYLKTLDALQRNDRIKMHAKATNNDYLLQMRQAPEFSEFAGLTRIYEYVWYGEFQPSFGQYEKIRHNFQQFRIGR